MDTADKIAADIKIGKKVYNGRGKATHKLTLRA